MKEKENSNSNFLNELREAKRLEEKLSNHLESQWKRVDAFEKILIIEDEQADRVTRAKNFVAEKLIDFIKNLLVISMPIYIATFAVPNKLVINIEKIRNIFLVVIVIGVLVWTLILRGIYRNIKVAVNKSIKQIKLANNLEKHKQKLIDREKEKLEIRELINKILSLREK